VTETADGLAAALAAVQAELPAVTKTRSADVQNKDGKRLYSYAYADLADVSAAIMPLLGRHGLSFTAFPGHQDDGKFGLRYYLLHASGERLEGFYEIPDQGGMQMTGGRITYARRYCLCAVTGVAAEDDVDAQGDGQSRSPRGRRGNGEQPQQTMQRKPRPQSSPPAQAAPPASAAGSAVTPSSTVDAGGDLPLLPGEDHDTPGTSTTSQRTAIWTVLTQVYHFDKEEKDQARGVCAQILNVKLKSSTDLSMNQASTVLDTLAHWQQQANERGDNPRAYLLEMLEAAKKARGGEAGE